MTQFKLKDLGRHAIRIACISVALCVVAPLLPGVEFHGSALTALAAGAGLLLVFEASRVLVHRRYGIGKGACPTPAMQKRLFVLYLALAVAYVLVAGSFGVFGLHVGILYGVVGALVGGVIALVGAIVSNIFERLILGNPYAQ